MLLDRDRDPHSQYGSGSRTAKSMRIRMHKTDLKGQSHEKDHFQGLQNFIITFCTRAGALKKEYLLIIIFESNNWLVSDNAY
jgi:hypothetical protein